MKALRAFGRFWYDLIIGDDWKIAVAVIVALAATFALWAMGVAEPTVTVLGGVLILGSFIIAVTIDLRRQ